MSDSTGLELTVPGYDTHSPQYINWVERDLGQCAVALLKRYEDCGSEVLSKTFSAVSVKLGQAHTQFACILQQGM